MGKRPKTQQHGAMLSKVVKAAEATAEATTARGAPSGRHVKRRKTSAASIFADSDDSSEDDGDVIVDAANPEDELKVYLNVPQIKYVTEQDMMNWWKDHQGEFPNVAVMARQYLGCPASSAAVERLFYQVAIAFSAKRKSAGGRHIRKHHVRKS